MKVRYKWYTELNAPSSQRGAARLGLTYVLSNTKRENKLEFSLLGFLASSLF